MLLTQRLKTANRRLKTDFVSPVNRAFASVVVIVVFVLDARAEQRPQPPAAAVTAEALTATAHPALPRDPSRLWLAPVARRSSSAQTTFSPGV